MAQEWYRGEAGVSRRVVKPYRGEAGVSRAILEGHRGVDGVARQFFSSLIYDVEFDTYVSTRNTGGVTLSYEVTRDNIYFKGENFSTKPLGGQEAVYDQIYWHLMNLKAGDTMEFDMDWYLSVTMSNHLSRVDFHFRDTSNNTTTIQTVVNGGNYSAGTHNLKWSYTLPSDGSLLITLHTIGQYAAITTELRVNSLTLNSKEFFSSAKEETI